MNRLLGATSTARRQAVPTGRGWETTPTCRGSGRIQLKGISRMAVSPTAALYGADLDEPLLIVGTTLKLVDAFMGPPGTSILESRITVACAAPQAPRPSALAPPAARPDQRRAVQAQAILGGRAGWTTRCGRAESRVQQQVSRDSPPGARGMAIWPLSRTVGEHPRAASAADRQHVLAPCMGWVTAVGPPSARTPAQAAPGHTSSISSSATDDDRRRDHS